MEMDPSHSRITLLAYTYNTSIVVLVHRMTRIFLSHPKPLPSLPGNPSSTVPYHYIAFPGTKGRDTVLSNRRRCRIRRWERRCDLYCNVEDRLNWCEGAKGREGGREEERGREREREREMEAKMDVSNNENDRAAARPRNRQNTTCIKELR